MMGKFAQILWRFPTGEASSSGGHATPFNIQVNFYIPLFEPKFWLPSGSDQTNECLEDNLQV
jgi:hypothetical protein